MSCIEATFEVNAGIKGDLDIEQITADVVPAEAAATITEQQKTIEAQAERIDELENGPYPKAVSDTYAIAESMEATMPSELTPENLATTVATIPYSPTSWQRPSDWPNYDYIDKTAEEAVYFTYDRTIGNQELSIQLGNATMERGYVDESGFHALATLTPNGDIFFENLNNVPESEGRYLVYKLTLENFNSSWYITSNGESYDRNNAYLAAKQPMVEAYGRVGFNYVGRNTDCSCLVGSYIKSYSVAHVTTSTSGTFSRAFYRAMNLENLDFSGSDCLAKDMTYMCGDCRALKFVNLDGLDMSQLTTVDYAFEDTDVKPSILQELDLAAATRYGCIISGVHDDDIDLRQIVNQRSDLSVYLVSASTSGTVYLPRIQSFTQKVFRDNFARFVDVPETVATIGSDAFDNLIAAGIGVTINIHNDEGAIEGAPWGATNATINWLGKD